MFPVSVGGQYPSRRINRRAGSEPLLLELADWLLAVDEPLFEREALPDPLPDPEPLPEPLTDPD